MAKYLAPVWKVLNQHCRLEFDTADPMVHVNSFSAKASVVLPVPVKDGARTEDVFVTEGGDAAYGNAHAAIRSCAVIGGG